MVENFIFQYEFVGRPKMNTRRELAKLKEDGWFFNSVTYGSAREIFSFEKKLK